MPHEAATTRMDEVDMADLLETGGESSRYVRDVEVAGSNPVAPTLAELLAALEGLQPGQTLLVEGLPNHVYHTLPCPSKSIGWDFRYHGPVWFYERHIAHTRPAFSSAATDLGTLVHAALELGPTRYRSHLVSVPEEFRTAGGGLSSSKAAKAWRDEQGPDAIVASEENLAIVEAILSQFFSNAMARDLYEDIWKHELSAFYRRPDGHLIRCRYDAVTHGGVLLDWKSCRDARPLESWWRGCLDHGYHYASAWYSQIAAAAGLSDQRLTFVACSTTPSHQVQVCELPEPLVAMCEQWITDDLDEIEARKESGHWLPSGYGEINVLQFPEWAFKGVSR